MHILLVGWNYWYMVYCDTYDLNTREIDTCFRSTQGGIIDPQFPIFISKYNKYMRGVELSDIRQLHFNETVMGLNQWLLKFLFYLLDAGTAHYLLLYRLLINNEPMDIDKFKLRLVRSLSNNMIEALPRSLKELIHQLVRIYMNNK